MDFQPFSCLEWNYVLSSAADDPAGASGSAKATEAEDIEDPAIGDVAGLSRKGKAAAGS